MRLRHDLLPRTAFSTDDVAHEDCMGEKKKADTIGVSALYHWLLYYLRVHLLLFFPITVIVIIQDVGFSIGKYTNPFYEKTYIKQRRR